MNDKYNIRIVTKCIDELSDFGFRLDIEIVWTQYNVKQIFFSDETLSQLGLVCNQNLWSLKQVS